MHGPGSPGTDADHQEDIMGRKKERVPEQLPEARPEEEQPEQPPVDYFLEYKRQTGKDLATGKYISQ